MSFKSVTAFEQNLYIIRLAPSCTTPCSQAHGVMRFPNLILKGSKCSHYVPSFHYIKQYYI